jgi:hypothetical protein
MSHDVNGRTDFLTLGSGSDAIAPQEIQQAFCSRKNGFSRVWMNPSTDYRPGFVRLRAVIYF